MKARNTLNNKFGLFKTLFLIVLSVFSISFFVGCKSDSKDDVDYPDVKEYFEENAEVKSVTKAKRSKNNLTEQDVIKELEARGFNQNPITTYYSIDGSFVDTKEISSDSKDKHPVYETYYVTQNDDMWVISVIDGTIIATPSSYNLNHNENVPIIISESEEIVSYDSSTNSFYKTIPNATVLDVRVVDKVDARTIEQYDLK